MAAFALFVLGLFVIMLSLLGCFGVTIESRGLLRVFMYFVFLLSLGFFAFGIVALVQSSLLITNLTNKWSTIRRFLPPTFSGKYDKEQFKIFLETNLLLLGFGALCVGLLLFIQWYASVRLRRSIKEEHELEDAELTFGACFVFLCGRDVFDGIFAGLVTSRCCVALTGWIAILDVFRHFCVLVLVCVFCLPFLDLIIMFHFIAFVI